MAQRGRTRKVPHGLTPVLLPGERLVAAVHAHWAKQIEPVASTVGAFLLAAWIDSNLTTKTQSVGTIVWLLALAVALRLAWRLLEWRHDWFVATDKRLIMRYGLITHKVAMMPLMKVTDMSYQRTIPGQLLGYGRFVMESAGQDQALRVVSWVPDSDRIYRAICSEIFHIDPDTTADAWATFTEDDDDADPRGEAPSPRKPTPPAAADDTDDDGYPDVPPIHNPVQDRLDSYSRAIPVRPRSGGESIYESEDRRRRRRSDDTGPIWPRS
ncbi:MAG: PH domain-containing protein [Terracoccus sp.]